MLTKSIMKCSQVISSAQGFLLVIKSVLLFYPSEVGLVWVEHYELIMFDN